MRAVGYVRVSTQNQVGQGVSLDAQEVKIKQWANLNGYELTAIYSNPGISGKEMETRQGLQMALEDIREGDALVVHSLSRLTRSIRDTLDIAELLKKRKADLVSISEKIETNTAAGKMVFRMLAVLNEFERDQVSERTKEALRHKREKKERCGFIPHGWKLAPDGRMLIEDPEEQAIVKKIRRLHSRRLSLREIAAKLNSEGMLNRGAPWNHSSVMRVGKF